jgi:hypothetical protein
VTGRRGRRRRTLLDDLKERGQYLHLKEEALDLTMWRARFGRGFGPVVIQNTEWMNVFMFLCHDLMMTLVQGLNYLPSNKSVRKMCGGVINIIHRYYVRWKFGLCAVVTFKILFQYCLTI